MYDDLVKSLRQCTEASCAGCKNEFVEIGCRGLLEHEAADAIEELSKKRVGTWHRFKATQRSYFFVCNSCGSTYPYLTRCCPNCGVEYIGEEPPEEEKK